MVKVIKKLEDRMSHVYPRPRFRVSATILSNLEKDI
jgi:hypothetical protein